MNDAELVAWVKHKLGYPVVQVELPDESIKLNIEDALAEVIPWYSATKFITVQATSSCIDLSEHNIREVISIRPSDSTMRMDNFFSDIALAGTTINARILPQLELMIQHQSVGYVKDNLSFDFIDNKLYIDMYPKSTSITIEYIPNINSVEDITDTRLLHYVKQFTLAFTKDVLSQVRGKFRVSNSPLELDADNLKDSSQTELERLRLALRDEFIDDSICD